MRILIFHCILFLIHSPLFGQSWETLAPFPGLGKDDAVAFSHENKGYLITGNNGGYDEAHLLFIYDELLNSWSFGTSFPGVRRQYAGHFQVGEKFYLVGGYSEFGNPLKDVWVYSPLSDNWIQLNDFPGDARWSMVSFAIENNGYVGTGTNGDTMLNDFWRYNPKTDIWSKQADFPVVCREAIGFSHLGKGVVGLGYSSLNEDDVYSGFYAFYPNENIWRSFSEYPGGKRLYSEVASNGIYAVIAGGMNEQLEFVKDAYQLLPDGSWMQIPDFSEGPIRGMSTFVIGANNYFVGGLKTDMSRSNELVRIQLDESPIPISIYPNPSKDAFNIELPIGSEIEIVNMVGQKVYLQSNCEFGYLNLSGLSPGPYIIRVSNNGAVKACRYIQL